jgi:hypothetical protein
MSHLTGIRADTQTCTNGYRYRWQGDLISLLTRITTEKQIDRHNTIQGQTAR